MSREKREKWKKGRGRRKGFFPQSSPLACFFLLTFLCTVSFIWTPEQVAGARRRLSCGYKKGGAGITVLPYPNLTWLNEKSFKIYNKCKELGIYIYIGTLIFMINWLCYLHQCTFQVSSPGVGWQLLRSRDLFLLSTSFHNNPRISLP